MEYYETDALSPANAETFKTWFDKEIGTDREENEVEDDAGTPGLVYFLCSDLTRSEVKKIRAFEIALQQVKA
jgi:hypothetical protein